MRPQMFQSTRPRGARPTVVWSGAAAFMCFNPRARAGATMSRFRRDRVRPGFNPRARAGLPTPAGQRRSTHPAFQSTRARAERDMIMPMPTASMTRFNPRARAGRDRASQRNSRSAAVFQSTRPRGGARQSPLFARGVERFQSTRRARPQPAWQECRGTVSIHARPRGARSGPIGAREQSRFQSSAPARGAIPRRPTATASFNPRWRGARVSRGSPSFQSTPARGATPQRDGRSGNC